MKLLSAEQIKRWDAFTIQQQGITSLELMERAAEKCVNWLTEHSFTNKHFSIFCGKGNNGGDGLAIARLLSQKGEKIDVYILEFGKIGTDDFQANLEQLHIFPVTIHFIQADIPLPDIQPSSIVIDTLFGAGLNKPLDGISKALVNHINQSKAKVIAIDVPSGLFLTQSSKGYIVIKATHTLTFQSYKLGLLLAENASSFGHIHILDIGLSKEFYEAEPSSLHTLDISHVSSIYKPRNRFAHKGTFGHALLIGGSYGKIGALVMATSACLRSGCGLTSVYIPTCGYSILQTTLPEAMVMTDRNDRFISQLPDVDLKSFSTIGLGPGLGTEEATQQSVAKIIKSLSIPLIIDADGLNCIALQIELLHQLPPYSILTPHPKEFDRLFGESGNEVARIEKAMEQAKALQVIIILKGHHTLIALPNGKAYFNMTGNAGMAKGGSGDVLTGIITSLLAQGYLPTEAALLGVYIHGVAGDHNAQALTQETMTATDLIQSLSFAFRYIQKPSQ
ncbi:MAG TPA: NAD(P)H-hydrate dehydratase [Flavisolibacter sp.]|nr:NAD(P)H-hydrate dehydratase [Flavisolibacter sp.]